MSILVTTFIIQVLRNFNLTPFYIGIFFGLRDGANSLASPIWGWLCDRCRPFLILKCNQLIDFEQEQDIRETFPSRFLSSSCHIFLPHGS